MPARPIVPLKTWLVENLQNASRRLLTLNPFLATARTATPNFLEHGILEVFFPSQLLRKIAYGRSKRAYQLQIVDGLAHEPAKVKRRRDVHGFRRGRTEYQKQDVRRSQVHYVVVGNRSLAGPDDDVDDQSVTNDADDYQHT